MPQEFPEEIIDLPEEGVKSIEELKNLSRTFFKNDLENENLNFFDSEEWEESGIKNITTHKTISFIQGTLFYTNNYFDENGKFKRDTYLLDNDEILFSIDNYIFTIEKDILIKIWEKNFKKSEEKNLYSTVNVDLNIYFFPYIKNIKKVNLTPGDDTLSDVLFSVTSCDNKIQIFKNKNIISKDKLISLYNKNYYVFNDYVKKGIISVTTYVRAF